MEAVVLVVGVLCAWDTPQFGTLESGKVLYPPQNPIVTLLELCK